MKQFNINYSSKESFKNYLHENDIVFANDKILVQIFTSFREKHKVQKIASEICEVLPNAVLIGSSSAGEIIDGLMQEESCVVAISVFEKTKIVASYVEGEDAYSMGVLMASKLLNEKSRCCINFVDGLTINGDEYLRGFSTLNTNSVIVSGGMSGDLFTFDSVFCIYQTKVLSSAAVGISLEGDELYAFNAYNLGWRAVGPKFTITKAVGNRVYEIDNKPIKELYREVLGSKIVRNMPASTIEFPFIKEVDSIPVARSMINIMEDGSVVYAGELNEGDVVRFGVGSKELIYDHNMSQLIASQQNDIQAGFIYSCSGRKQFLGKELESNFQYYEKIAPVSGFFTFGEFFSGLKESSLLNITTTLLFLYEKNTENISKNRCTNKSLKDDKQKTLTNKGLFNLVDYVTKNLDFEKQNMEKSKKRLDELLEAIDSVSIISKTDSKGIITYVNDAFVKISGYSREELLGRNHNLVRSPNSDASLFKEMWQTIQKGEIWQGELENRTKDGHLYYVKSSIIPLHDINGKIVEYLAIREDVSSLVGSKKEIEKQNALTNIILDNEESIIILTKNDEIDRINEAFFRTFPYENLETFKSWHRCICELFIEKENYLQKKLDASQRWYDPILHEPFITHLAAMIDKNGNERIYHVKSKEIMYDEDTAYVVSTFHDITEIEQAKQKAQKAEAAQAMFLANMSHEIRTPMNGIIGFTELLEKTPMNESQEKYVDIIKGSTQTLLGIINDILDFSKISGQKIELENLEINPYHELDATFELLRAVAEKKNLDYVKKLDTNMFECIYTDPTRLRQVLTNLLSNAIKFTPEDGSVSLETHVLNTNAESQFIRFEVKDTGIGIPQSKQKTIFEPFSQADSSTTREFGGTGLGLSISNSFVKAMGAELCVKSKEKEGSVFYFDLEFKRCNSLIELKELMQQWKVVILEDDDEILLQRVGDILSSFGVVYEIVPKELADTFVLGTKSIVIAFENIKEFLFLKEFPKDQIICLSEKKLFDYSIECVDLIIDESLASNLYNFLFRKLKNKNIEKKQIEHNSIALNILIAEDYEMNRILMETIFEQYKNICITFAKNGDEAVAKVLHNDFDIVLMDVNMPILNGLEATKIIRKKLSKHIPIIALTANALEGDRERFLAAGMDDYLSKPIEIGKLEEILQKFAQNGIVENFKPNKEIEKNICLDDMVENITQNLGVAPEMAITLLHSFYSSLDLSFIDLQKAVQSRDNQMILNLVHKIKGSSSTMRIDTIASLMQEIEEKVKKGETINYDKIFDIMQKYLKSLQRELKNVS